jgi:capsular polysaccharide transport system permease protein
MSTTAQPPMHRTRVTSGRRTGVPVPATPTPSLTASLGIQARVVAALVMREVITRYGRRNLGMLWLVVEPALFTIGVAALWSLANLQKVSAIPIIAFAITGYSGVLLWRNTATQGLHAIKANTNLLFHRNVRLLDVFMARTALEVAGATASLVLLASVCTALGLIAAPQDPLTAVFAWVLLAWFAFGLALVLGSASAFTDLMSRIWTPLSYLLFPVSGAAFMVEWLPPAGRELVLWLPMVHATEMLREGYFGSVVRTHHDVGYLCTVNLLLTAFGLLLLRVAAARANSQ